MLFIINFDFTKIFFELTELNQNLYICCESKFSIIMKNYFKILVLALSVSFTSCDKDTDESNSESNSGVVPVTDVYGCTDENAINFESLATLDNGSCAFSIAYLATGDWNITNLEYETEFDLSIIDASILDAIQPGLSSLLAAFGSIPIEGEAENAGSYSLSMDNSFTSDLSFTTEPIAIPLIGDIPGLPIDLSSNGVWSLQNQEEEILFVDALLDSQQLYSIDNLTEEFALLRGTLIVIQEIPLIGLYELEIELELTLEK